MKWVNSGFDRLMAGSGGAAPFLALVVCSLAAGLIIVVAFRWLTLPRKLRRTRDVMMANMLGVRLFRDQVRVALLSYALVGRSAAQYVLLVLPAAAALTIPLMYLYGQLSARLDYTAPARGEQVLLTARLRPGTSLNGVRLDLPHELRLTAPAVHVPSLNEVTWRIQLTECGSFPATVFSGGDQATQPVHACDAWQHLTPDAEQRSLAGLVLDPAGETLPAGAIQRVTVDYPERTLRAAGHEVWWPLVFFLLAGIFAFLLKPLTGAEF